MEQPSHHHYCYGVIQLFVRLVLNAPTSLRGASGALSLVQALLFPHLGSAPTANCGRLWLLRIGLYELSRQKEIADDWLWIVDHTVQIGTVKCLLVVGCRLSQWQDQRRPLQLQDLSLLALEPVQESDAKLVEQQLKDVIPSTGVPRAILSDGASELKRAIENFGSDHPETANLYDIKHKAALILKRVLAGDDRWSQFLKQVGQVRKQVLQTTLAFLLPPAAKEKARYMNLDAFVSWAQKVRAYLDAPVSPEGMTLEIGRLNLTFNWLREYDLALAEWAAVMHVIATTLEYVRNEGYHGEAADELRKLLDPLSPDALSRRMADELVQVIQEQSAHAQPAERLIGSSECIESLIGKGKRLEGQQSRSGFTKMVLGLGAAVVNPTTEFIQEALATITTNDVLKWSNEKLGLSLQAQRRLALPTNKEQKQHKKPLAHAA